MNIPHLTEIAILLLLIITFGYSSYEKIADFKGQLAWLTDYFKNTFMQRFIKIALIKVLIFEVIATILCVLGVVALIIEKSPHMALYGCILCVLVLFFFVIGQRIVKDYDGARNTVIYLIPSFFLLYLLTH
ncbi:hypothetical protein NBRC110019_19540 [Neptunitalea chrysea]|uniref:DoxX family protein n=1 Tax=Neptunitalea chrysea TaxID=1647581 RepID=A0A9W6B5E4_9FLAO|nr:DoxX family protein [Neptunitalea chrysea]GLB52914.1 hypothetical protein NBRC110019_19540 [Neptunitalea chrysea]